MLLQEMNIYWMALLLFKLWMSNFQQKFVLEKLVYAIFSNYVRILDYPDTGGNQVFTVDQNWCSPSSEYADGIITPISHEEHQVSASINVLFQL